MNVRFCTACRSLILADFRYCPYCGQEVKGPGLSEALERPFDRMTTAVPTPTTDQAAQSMDNPHRDDSNRPKTDVFAHAAESLERLEADMDLILEELEKERRS
jgi:wobble nucleotide-excising tRNase